MRYRTLLLLVVTLLAAAVVVAQEAGTTNYSGKITSINAPAGTFVVQTPDGPITFRSNAGSTYMIRGQSGRINDLKVGDQVTLTSTGTGSERTLSRVEIMAVPGGSGTMGERGTTTTTSPTGSTGPTGSTQPTDENYERNPGSGTTGTTRTGEAYRGGTTGSRTTATGPYVTGVITAIDVPGNTMTIRTSDGTTTVYTLDPDVRYMSRGMVVTSNDLTVGDRVRVNYTGTTDRTASNVEVMSGGTTGTSSARLPRTASSTPLFGLVGLGLVATFIALRSLRLLASH